MQVILYEIEDDKLVEYTVESSIFPGYYRHRTVYSKGAIANYSGRKMSDCPYDGFTGWGNTFRIKWSDGFIDRLHGRVLVTKIATGKIYETIEAKHE